jgi:hypothetical protein
MDDLKNYSNCISYAPKALELIYPVDESDLKNILKEANARSQTISVYSRGNNWGYGAKAPYQENSLQISLERWDKIKDFDSQKGLVRIQPGVSFQQLSDFLVQQGDEWLCPVHGGGPNCSVLGNVLERGFGITPIEDHFSSLMGLRALMPNCEVYESSFSSMGMKKLDDCFHWGIGPYMDGIFTQSNYGIVTEICIRLAPKKESIQVIVASFKSGSKIDDLVRVVQKIQNEYSGIIGGINLMNKERMLSMLVPYPGDSKRVNRALNREEVEKLAKIHSLQEWNLVLSLHGKKKICTIAAKSILSELKGFTTRQVRVDRKKLSIIGKLASVFPKFFGIDLRQTHSSLQELFSILNGSPQNTALKLAYWMSPIDPVKEILSPDLDGCGLIWYSPIIPMEPNVLKKFLLIAEEKSKEFGINNLLTLTSFNGQCFECTFPILYNKSVEGASENAQSFYFSILHEASKIGCYPYRLPLFAMKEFQKYSDTPSFSLGARIKNLLDPKGILSPGRYVSHIASLEGLKKSNQL